MWFPPRGPSNLRPRSFAPVNGSLQGNHADCRVERHIRLTACARPTRYWSLEVSVLPAGRCSERGWAFRSCGP